MANEIRHAYYFEIVWTWNCDEVLAYKGMTDEFGMLLNDILFFGMPLNDILFYDKEDVRDCLDSGINLWQEVYICGEPDFDIRPATVVYNEKLGLYEFQTEIGQIAMAELREKDVMVCGC